MSTVEREPREDRQQLGAGMSETTDRNGAFPRLSEGQLERLRAVGEVRAVAAGEILYREGEETYDLFVVLSGSVAVVCGYGMEDRVLGVHGARRFLGELNLLTGRCALVTSVVRDPGEVIQVPVISLRRLLSDDDELAKLMLRAYLARRSILIEIGAGVRVLGFDCAESTSRVRDFLTRNRVPHQWVDLDGEEVSTLATAMRDLEDELPLVICGESVLRNPSSAELASGLGLTARGPSTGLCDLVVVGGGPAGLAAGVYGASEGLKTIVLDRVAFGGQAGTSSRIENYLGFPAGVTGANLTERAILQAGKFGAEMIVAAEARTLFPAGGGELRVGLSDGRAYRGRCVILATGAQYRKLEVDGIDRLATAGVYYAATVVEAQRCAGGPVVVVGGGNSAGQAAVFLARYSDCVRVVIRGEDICRSMSQYLVDQLRANPRIKIVTEHVVTAVGGGDRVQSVTLEDRRSGEPAVVPASGLFVFVGASPRTSWLPKGLATDEHGFLLTGRDVPPSELSAFGPEGPLFLETSIPGVFAVGDVRSGSVKRVASAVGEGSMAVKLAHQVLAERAQRLAGF
jgi:thioredoxin reductase (NADPH)